MVTPAQYAQLVAALLSQAGGPELAKHQRQAAAPPQQQHAPVVAERPSWLPDPKTAIPWIPVPDEVKRLPPLKIPPHMDPPDPPGRNIFNYMFAPRPGFEEWEAQGSENRNRILGQAWAPDEPPMRWPNVIDPRGIPDGWPYPYEGQI